MIQTEKIYFLLAGAGWAMHNKNTFK